MNTETVDVHLGGGPSPVRIGTLRPSFQGGRTLAGSSFEYTPRFITSSGAYPISPELPLKPGRVYTPENQTLFGAFADASPDQWGQKLIDANHAAHLKANPDFPKRLGAFDYLTGVSDATRMGGLRLSQNGAWLTEDDSVASIHDLDKVISAARRYEADEASQTDLEYLNAIATTPGGARPKANVVLASGQLALAKLPHSKDGALDTEAWESVALTIAQNSGIRTTQFQLLHASANKSVLVTARFDRGALDKRYGYISAATALGIGANDDSRATYQDFADTIAGLSAEPEADLREMFARVCLSVLINNADDHWRNHGFIREDSGWRLSPTFDINPSPRRGLITSRAISSEDDPRARDIRNLAATADSYRLSSSEAALIMHRVGAEVLKWPDVAAAAGIPGNQLKLMRAAFDIEQLEYTKAAAPVPHSIAGSATNSQLSGEVWVKPHTRHGSSVDGYWRSAPTVSQ